MADQVELEVPEALDGERVDKVVAALLDLSRARASELLGEVTLDGVPARPSDRVAVGQIVVCASPEAQPVLIPEEVVFTVVYEDDDVIVVDKPPGVVVHPGSGRSTGTLAAGLIHRYPDLVGVGEEGRWGLIHRLDKDTSGVILVARNPESFLGLRSQLREREIERRYLALVEGSVSSATGTVDAPIGRDPQRPTRRAVTHRGKHARTHYEVVRRYEESDATLLSVKLETGRTHQIRVHLSAIGHPVAGDRVYGASRKDLAAPRTFLHAESLAFSHPITGERLDVHAELPGDLKSVLDRLE